MRQCIYIHRLRGPVHHVHPHAYRWDTTGNNNLTPFITFFPEWPAGLEEHVGYK